MNETLDILVVQVADSCKLKVAVHHGVHRDTNPEQLMQYDVVITSYETLRSEHRQPGASGLLR